MIIVLSRIADVAAWAVMVVPGIAVPLWICSPGMPWLRQSDRCRPVAHRRDGSDIASRRLPGSVLEQGRATPSVGPTRSLYGRRRASRHADSGTS
jgi:hypothetical protein